MTGSHETEYVLQVVNMSRFLWFQRERWRGGLVRRRSVDASSGGGVLDDEDHCFQLTKRVSIP
jgi:hypothetical protein